MSKQEFLNELQNALCGLPQEDIQKSVDFYSEIIDDRIEEGILEEEAVAQLGCVKEIAEQILIDTPITKLVKQKINKKRRMGAGEIVLLVLGSPIWLSIIIALIAVMISIYVSLWSVVISLWACETAFIGCVLGGIASTGVLLVMGHNIFAASVMVATTLILVGLSILFFFVCKYATKGMIWLSKKFTIFIKSFFLRKERAE